MRGITHIVNLVTQVSIVASLEELGFWGFGVLGFWGFGVLGFWGFGVFCTEKYHRLLIGYLNILDAAIYFINFWLLSA